MAIRLEAYHDRILSSLSTGVFVVDLASTIVYVNDAAAEMVEEKAPDLMGKSLLTQSRLFPLIPVINEHRKNNPSLAVSGRQVETAIKRKDGAELPLGCSVTNLTDGDDVVLGYVILFRDLSELNKLKEAARRSEHLAALGTMAAGVAHEIRNPLHAIRASVELTQLKLKKNKPVDEYLRIILKEVGRLNDIVGDILDFSRNNPLNQEMTDIGEYLAGAVPMFGLPSSTNLNIEVPDDIPPVPLDQSRFLQVLINIVRNASEAMKGDGELTISASLVSEPRLVIYDNILGEMFLCLAVADNGPGMDKETVRHIFEPFFSSGKASKGTGLGLPICQKIIESHCGCIEVSSSPGEGSVFSIYLPVRTTFSIGMSK